MPYYACPEGHGDFNNDGIIDDQDWQVFQECYLKSIADFLQCASADMDDDGLVDVEDSSIFAAIWDGYCPVCGLYLTEYIPPPSSLESAITFMSVAVMMGLVMGMMKQMVKK